jgi:hypothetical protein
VVFERRFDQRKSPPPPPTDGLFIRGSLSCHDRFLENFIVSDQALYRRSRAISAATGAAPAPGEKQTSKELTQMKCKGEYKWRERSENEVHKQVNLKKKYKLEQFFEYFRCKCITVFSEPICTNHIFCAFRIYTNKIVIFNFSSPAPPPFLQFF